MGKILTHCTPDRRVISKLYKKLKKLDTSKPNNPTKNGVQIKTENS